MTLKSAIIAANNGLFLAVPDTYTGPTIGVDIASLPTDGVLTLNSTAPEIELAVRLVADSTTVPVAVMGNEVAVNVGERAVGVDPTVLVATGATLKTMLMNAGAPENYVDSPRNFGGPTILSFLTDPTDDLKRFVIALCNGDSDYNEAYLGIVPPDRRTIGTGNDGLYAVYTDAQATEAASAVAATRVETLLGQTPAVLHEFINETSVINSMLLPANGGRGGLLASDGEEHKVTITDSSGTPTDYFVYLKG